MRQQGAHEVFDHTKADYLDAIRERTQGKGVQIILEMLANKNLANDLKLLAVHGRVVIIGSRGPIEINPRDTMARELDIRGVMGGHATQAEIAECHDAILTGLDNGTLCPAIAEEMPLAEAPKAHELVMSAKPPGKIILVP